MSSGHQNTQKEVTLNSTHRIAVLIVDDDQVDRETVARFVGKEYELHQAATGKDALERVEHRQFGCILLDLGLPDFDGQELIEPLSERAPVVVMTGHGNERAAVEAMKRGAADYLVKDMISGVSLKRAVTGAIEKQQLEYTVEEQRRRLLEDERLKVLIQLAGSSLLDLNEPLSHLNLALDKLMMSQALPDTERSLVEKSSQALSDVTAIMRRVQQMRLQDAAPLPDSGIAMPPCVVLCVDDDPVSLAILKRHLESLSSDMAIVDVRTASSIAEATESLAANSTDLVVSDYHLGDGTAMDLLPVATKEDEILPVIVISGVGDEDVVADVLRAGASDYIPKGSLSVEKLGAALKRSLERAAIASDLRRSQARMHALAFTDELTKLYNRRFLEESMARELQRLNRHPGALAFCLLDLDHFKRLNDAYGHAAGDQALRDVGEILRNSIRRTDLAARYGGEEFAVFLTDADESAAVAVAEGIREKIDAHQVQFEGLSLELTVSVGVSLVRNEDDRNIAEIISAADAALYRAKTEGRNRVLLENR